MSNIVADVMTSFQSDFENFDRPYIENAYNSKFPMIWIVGKSYTYLLHLGEYEENFRENEVHDMPTFRVEIHFSLFSTLLVATIFF